MFRVNVGELSKTTCLIYEDLNKDPGNTIRQGKSSVSYFVMKAKDVEKLKENFLTFFEMLFDLLVESFPELEDQFRILNASKRTIVMDDM